MQSKQKKHSRECNEGIKGINMKYTTVNAQKRNKTPQHNAPNYRKSSTIPDDRAGRGNTPP
jgi:hypothetical protein